ncbi:hypothetical protein GCM10010471_30780 [Leucobacter komagatae]
MLGVGLDLIDAAAHHPDAERSGRVAAVSTSGWGARSETRSKCRRKRDRGNLDSSSLTHGDLHVLLTRPAGHPEVTLQDHTADRIFSIK